MFKQPSTKKQFQIGDIKLDHDTNQVWRGDNEILLPKLSFKLLKVLAENSPNLLEQEELIGEIWPEMVVGVETLKQRVRLLRKSLGDDAKSPRYIAAVRGRGYRLVPEVKVLLINQVTPIEFDLAGTTKIPNLVNLASLKIWRQISLALMTFIVLLITSLYLLSEQIKHDSKLRSLQHLAILPFINVTQNPEDNYLVSGMTNELIGVMSQIEQLKISPRSASDKYRNSERVISEIANNLNVGAILDGALYRRDKHLHFNFQLIDSNNLTQLWQAEFDFGSDDILAIQRKVITQVSKHLKAKLNPSQILDSLTLTQPTQIVQAYDLYLKGRNYYNRYRQADNLTAIQFYQQALELDPDFSLAHAGLADAYSQAVFQFGALDSWRQLALSSALKAVRLDDSKAESHKALGLAYYLNGNIKKGIETNIRAIKISPSHAQAVTNLAYLYRQTGQLNKALQWNKRAIELTPQYAPVWAHYAQTLENLEQYDDAELNYQKALQLQPDYAFAIHLYANFLNLSDRQSEALQLLESARQSSPNEYEYLFSAGKIYLYSGNYTSATAFFERALKQQHPSSLELRLLSAIAKHNDSFVSVEQTQLKQLQQITQLWLKQRVAQSDNPQDLFILSLSLAAQKEYQQSAQAIETAVELGWTDKRMILHTQLLEQSLKFTKSIQYIPSKNM